jgi:hypothetical protein
MYLRFLAPIAAIPFGFGAWDHYSEGSYLTAFGTLLMAIFFSELHVNWSNFYFGQPQRSHMA